MSKMKSYEWLSRERRGKMKGKKLTAFLLTAAVALSAVQPVFAADWQSGNRLIAHAFGEVDNKIETNSKVISLILTVGLVAIASPFSSYIYMV